RGIGDEAVGGKSGQQALVRVDEGLLEVTGGQAGDSVDHDCHGSDRVEREADLVDGGRVAEGADVGGGEIETGHRHGGLGLQRVVPVLTEVEHGVDGVAGAAGYGGRRDGVDLG